ncbi:10364_t:CDS:2, partial [Entrophospora sp. SA101]
MSALYNDTESDSDDAVSNSCHWVSDDYSKSVDELKKFRKLWWDQGLLHPKAKWTHVELPYVLVEGVTLEEYERRGDVFNIHGLWEWSNGTVTIIEFPSTRHDVCVCSITKVLLYQCNAVTFTDAEVYALGSSLFKETRADGCGKEADASFRPEKIATIPPNGSDGNA